MNVRIFDAWSSDDPALVNSHWVAQQTAAVLGDETLTVEGAAITRASVDADLLHTAFTGFVFCGHGSDRALWGVGPRDGREALVDQQNVSAVGDRWLHAFACLSGCSLALSAPYDGVGAYAGYNVKVIVEFTAPTLPEDLAVLLRDAVTCTSRGLRDGVRNERALLASVRRSCWRVKAWLHANRPGPKSTRVTRGEWLGLMTLTDLLVDNLELHGLHIEKADNSAP